ncbi:MAG: hypothetical protein JXA89_04940, partial [Anaerolineae bacterium]|nr:hypothetical protein [Anaerolineae bacterium]
MDQAQPALMLHGSWSENTFFVWAETSQRSSDASLSDSRTSETRPSHHPCAATPDSLLIVLEQFAPFGGWTSSILPAERIMFLPSNEEQPYLPPWLVAQENESDTPPHLAPWQVPGLALDLFSAIDLLVALPAGHVDQHRFGADLRYWALVAKLGLEFLVNHKYLPGLERQADVYRAVWLPIVHDPADRARLRTLAQSMPPICRAVFLTNTQPKAQDAIAPHTLLDDFLRTWIDQAVRHWGARHLDRRRKTPAGIAGVWWSALWRESGEMDISVTQQHNVVQLFEAWQTWISQLYGSAEEAFRVCFRLEPPQIDDETGHVTEPDWALRYMLQANDDPSLLVQAEQVWSARGGALRTLNRKFEGAQEKLLAGL